MDEKRCTTCGVSKLLSEFTKNKRCSNGVTGRCKACTSDYTRDWSQADRKANPEKAVEQKKQRKKYNRKYHQANRDVLLQRKRKRYQDTREARLAARQVYYEHNRECILADMRERYQADETYRTSILDKNRIYLRANPEVDRAKHARRRQQAITQMSKEDKQISVEYRKAIANDTCLYCGAPGKHTDHWMSLAKGGTDHWWNLVRACASCNSSKNARCGSHFMRDEPCTC